MTKQEIKALVASKIEGQGNQVDLGGVLSAVIGEIVDLLPERKPVTIDLSGFDLTTDTDVTSAIPSGYIPQEGDKVIYGVHGTLAICGYSIVGENMKAVYGFGGKLEDVGEKILIFREEGVCYAQFYEI